MVSLAAKLFLVYCMIQLVISKIKRIAIDKDTEKYGWLGFWFLGLIFGCIGLAYLVRVFLPVSENIWWVLMLIPIFPIIFYFITLICFGKESSSSPNIFVDLCHYLVDFVKGIPDVFYVILMPFIMVGSLIYYPLKWVAARLIKLLIGR